MTRPRTFWLWRLRSFVQTQVPLVLLDLTILGLAMWAAFLLRFDGQIPPSFQPALVVALVLSVALKGALFGLLGLYRWRWPYVGLEDALRLMALSGVASAVLTASLFFLRPVLHNIVVPRSVLILDGLLTTLGLVGVRFLPRIWRTLQRSPWWHHRRGRRTLIVGAGDAAAQLVRYLREDPLSAFHPVGLVDDNPARWGTRIYGVPVLGPIESLPAWVQQYRVETVLIAVPSAPARVVSRAIQLAQQSGVRDIKRLPPLAELLSREIRPEHLREVRLEDVLGREPIRIETETVLHLLRGRRVLVTGAAGSIGAELCRQILRFEPELLIALDVDESRLFWLERRFRAEGEDLPLRIEIGDIRDYSRMAQVFRTWRPHVVFHAAAYKHVPLMERHPAEAVKTNVLGTWVVARQALVHRVDHFVLISTDKAVRPRSVMGATKRIAEMVVYWYQLQARRRQQPTRFVAVRFGNVLGSRGSVFTIFQDQIRRGGPVTVTHPDMRRYFMLPQEAALLVLQAAALGEGGEIFVLDMGEPVRIVELARTMIRLAGYEPDRDIAIVFTGRRPGEKLYEELLSQDERQRTTRHQRVFIAAMDPDFDPERFCHHLRRLWRLARQGREQALLREIQALVPTFQPERPLFAEEHEPGP